jgi:hypothetical protein
MPTRSTICTKSIQTLAEQRGSANDVATLLREARIPRSEASVALVRKLSAEMQHVWIAIGIQTALVQVIETEVIPQMEVVPISAISTRKMRSHADHAGSA